MSEPEGTGYRESPDTTDGPVADDLETTPDPTDEELRLIREELDPDGVYVKS